MTPRPPKPQPILETTLACVWDALPVTALLAIVGDRPPDEVFLEHTDYDGTEIVWRRPNPDYDAEVAAVREWQHERWLRVNAKGLATLTEEEREAEIARHGGDR
jgi:hypothetical protein